MGIWGYTRYCGEMKRWTANVEHVAFLGKKKIHTYYEGLPDGAGIPWRG